MDKFGFTNTPAQDENTESLEPMNDPTSAEDPNSQNESNRQYQEPEKESVFEKSWFSWVFSFLFPPLALWTIWAKSHMKKGAKIGATVVASFFLIVALSSFGSGSSSSTTSTAASADLSQSTQTEETQELQTADTQTTETPQTDSSAAAQEEEAAYSNTAVAAELYSGEWAAPTDVQPGHYTITSGSGSGNLAIYSKDGDLTTNEILGDSDYGITSYETYILDGDTIKIEGMDAVEFTPTDPVLSTSKTAGIYIVRTDIPSGTYTATAPAGSGNFVVYSSSGSLKTNEILGDSDYAVEKVKVTLRDKDIVEISSLNEVDFN